MTVSFFQIISFLILAIVVIIVLTTKYKVHAFFALLIACFVVGAGVGMPVATIIEAAKKGFGNIMQSLALIIVLGTTLGILLEHTGATRVMAGYLIRKTGERRAPLAMSLTGFIVGLPIFCDSGYIVLSGLNNSLAKRTAVSVVILGTSLATGLYAVHCLIPPHPGAAAAVGTIGADVGRQVMIGTLCAIPAMLAGYWWAMHAGKKMPVVMPPHESGVPEEKKQPSVGQSFLPVVVPIVLIALKSFTSFEDSSHDFLSTIIHFLGDPVIALSAGIVLAFTGGKNWKRDTVGLLLQAAAERAGGILIIIGAGGAFGAVLAAVHIGDYLGSSTALESLGLFFPFLVTFVLKTAQGSSTVAIITAASIVQPLLPALGLDSPDGKLIAVLSMGAGSMMISHANDAYFWVIAKFSGMDIKSMLKVYSVATIFMGLVTLLVTWLLSLFLL